MARNCLLSGQDLVFTHATHVPKVPRILRMSFGPGAGGVGCLCGAWDGSGGASLGAGLGATEIDASVRHAHFLVAEAEEVELHRPDWPVKNPCAYSDEDIGLPS